MESYMLEAQYTFDARRPRVAHYWYSVVHRFRVMGIAVMGGMIRPRGLVHPY